MKHTSQHRFQRALCMTGIILAVMMCNFLFAQEVKKIKFPDRMLGLNTGYSQHLSQSLGGFSLGINHAIKTSKKISFHNDFTFTLHNGKEASHNASLPSISSITAVDPWFKSEPLKFVTAGIQTSAAVSVGMMSGRVRTGAGPLIRYQTSSRPASYAFNVSTRQTTLGTFYSTSYVINSIKPHSFSAGVLLFIDVAMFKTKKIEAKGSIQYQFDTQGDKILSTGIKLQKSYKKTS